MLDQRYTHLDLFISKTCWRLLQDMSSRRLQDTSSGRLQGMSSRRLQDMSSRRLQDVFSLKIFRYPRRLEDVVKTFCKMSSRRFQGVFARRLGDEKLLRWRRVEDVFKTCPEDVFKTSWRPTNVCWVWILNASLFSILFSYILIGGLSVTLSCILMI